MPKVYNKRHKDVPADSVYVGLPSKWGNPFEIGKHGDREQVIALYKQWLLSDPRRVRQAIYELEGRDLVCWCAPAHCHADVLLEVANSTQDF